MAEAVLELPRSEEKEKEESEVCESEQEIADREFALKLSQRLNEELPPIPPSIAVVEEPSSISTTSPVGAESTEDEDYKLALRISQELNGQERPAPTYVAAPTPAATLYSYQPPRPVPLTQEEADKRLALQLQQELNADERVDREVALRVSQELNGQPPMMVMPPPPPPRTVYATPGRYVVVRSAEEIRIEGEIARIAHSLSKETDPDAKIALDLQLQELVAYQRQLQRRKIRNEDYSDEEDMFEDGMKLLDAGYEKFKGFSKDVVQTLDRYGGKFEKAISKLTNKIGNKDDSAVATEANTGEKNVDGAVETQPAIADSDDEPLLKTNSSRKEKGLSLKIVETIDKVTEEFGDTVAEIFFGDKAKSNNLNNSNSNNDQAAPNSPALLRAGASSASATESLQPTTSSSATTSTTTTTTVASIPTTSNNGGGLTDFKGGEAKDSDDSLYPL